MRRTATFPLDDFVLFKKHLLHWAAAHDVAIFLDSNQPPSADVTWDCLVGAGAAKHLVCPAGQAFSALQNLRSREDTDWLFGFLSYDLKNEVERLTSTHFDGVGFPDLAFFQPETVVGIRNSQVEICCLSREPQEVYAAIMRQRCGAEEAPTTVQLQPRFPKSEYLASVEALRQHIVEGDVYEVNLCQEFFAENAALDPLVVFERLNSIAQAPFTTFLRWQHRYLLSASPERFLKKRGQKVISQPIKGTRRRGATAADDERVRRELAASEKDRAENVMIVDLVRNDLARHCLPGSVRADELFGIYTFPTVHQMISTVSGELLPGAGGLDLLRDAFPMGSMTGAPKVMAMQLIEQYERSRRGLYSGAVGYFDPAGDFDFNVVIRSILYDAASGYVSASVGGAIVFDSDPEQEYEECLLKAEAMRKALEG